MQGALQTMSVWKVEDDTWGGDFAAGDPRDKELAEKLEAHLRSD